MIQLTIKGGPIAKPRMTRRDKWQHRPCVASYRAWKDIVRYSLTAGQREALRQMSVVRMVAIFYLPIPRTTKHVPGAPHLLKPDADNLGKGLKDALFEKDEIVWDERFIKRWDDGNGPRVELEIEGG